jgi:hypothetical protein
MTIDLKPKTKDMLKTMFFMAMFMAAIWLMTESVKNADKVLKP